MRGSRSVGATLLLLLILACFLTVPVISSETPWDADSNDDGGSGTQGNGDDDGDDDPVVIESNEDKPDDTEWYESFLFRLFLKLVIGSLTQSGSNVAIS